MKRAFAAAGITLLGVAHAGHEFPFYPSFYPQEITIEALDAPSAAQRLAEGTLHVYAGSLGADPAKTLAVESLGALVVATFEREAPCDRAYEARDAPGTNYTAHPYPVTGRPPRRRDRRRRCRRGRRSSRSTRASSSRGRARATTAGRGRPGCGKAGSTPTSSSPRPCPTPASRKRPGA
jgi:hypothetical protein